ncbi:MAG TPA: SufD family Fe-S cluster assembly protein, partial [Flavobacteriaceae bacterium]|nr:SufD family Fe-S cluster assembly protein [Flavobacteriaceae bacterium]
LPEEALFYLRSRGIPKKEAEAVMMLAFANTVLESVRIPALREEVMRLIANKLGAEVNIEI